MHSKELFPLQKIESRSVFNKEYIVSASSCIIRILIKRSYSVIPIMPFSYLQYYTMTIQINHYLHIICARNFLFLITLHFKNFMVPDTLLRQIHLSDKLFTHTSKFSHLAQLYFQVSNCTYHSHLQFLLGVHICNIKFVSMKSINSRTSFCDISISSPCAPELPSFLIKKLH